MNEPLVASPEDNIYLEIEMKNKNNIASCCNCLCFIFFVVNISVFFILRTEKYIKPEILIEESFTWIGAIIVSMFMCCNFKQGCSKTIFVLTIIFCLAIPAELCLIIIRIEGFGIYLYIYIGICGIRLAILIYLVTKIRALSKFNNSIRTIKKRVGKLKRRSKNGVDKEVKIAILPKMLDSEDITMSFSCSGSFTIDKNIFKAEDLNI